MKPRVSAPDARKRELAKIHILKAELRLEEDEYRTILWSVGRQRSSADLDQAGRLAVLDHLTSRKRRERPAGERPAVQADLRPMVNKIEMLLKEGGLSWEYARAIGERMFRVEQIEWLRGEQLRAVIAALEVNARRKAKAAR